MPVPRSARDEIYNRNCAFEANQINKFLFRELDSRRSGNVT
jgi:hypothetical protein